MDDRVQDRIRGCLIGGAAGDALGYAVEFATLDYILERFGKNGITGYVRDPGSGLALISDDTQMTMFTAEGVLRARASGKSMVACVKGEYACWLRTQQTDFEPNGGNESCLLMKLPRLYSRRAPGNTCLSALMMRAEENAPNDDYIAAAINESKGCGGVMRAAPAGIVPGADPDRLAYTAAQTAAITHSHPMGYMPAAVLAYIVNRLVYAEGDAALTDVVEAAKRMVGRVFSGSGQANRMIEWLDSAAALARNAGDDAENIRRLGEGWVGDEALAIALYCCLRHENDFSAAIIAAVNHSGDSDSTGAIAGNIMGALHGYSSMENKWKTGLELSDAILGLADDLCAPDGAERLSKYAET